MRQKAFTPTRPQALRPGMNIEVVPICGDPTWPAIIVEVDGYGPLSWPALLFKIFMFRLKRIFGREFRF